MLISKWVGEVFLVFLGFKEKLLVIWPHRRVEKRCTYSWIFWKGSETRWYEKKGGLVEICFAKCQYGITKDSAKLHPYVRHPDLLPTHSAEEVSVSSFLLSPRNVPFSGDDFDYIEEKLRATWSPEQITCTPSELKMPSWRRSIAGFMRSIW